MEKGCFDTPFVDALEKYIEEGISPFDVPGHHMGNVKNKMSSLIGRKAYICDVNAPIGLDNLAHPSGVILKAEELMAKACHADKSYFLINGTTSGLQAAILATLKPNDKIILPRNVHKSITNCLVLSGVIPIYINPDVDTNLEIANQPSLLDYEKAMNKYPSAKAIVVINPTYFGVVLDLVSLVKIAHKHNMLVIADEAHGAHYYFSEEKPINAMEAGCDISSVSFHKTGGSLTQSSVLLTKGERIDNDKILSTLNLLNSTSPSSLLIGSLDAARAWMEEFGQDAINNVIKLSEYAFDKISKIDGFIPRGKQYFKNRDCYDYDKTKLLIELDRLDLNGYEVYRLLKNKYHIQIELAETYVILCIIAIGNKKSHIDNLIKALKDISKNHFKKKMSYPTHNFHFEYGYMITRPRTAYFANSKTVLLDDALNHICKESIMIYPPGIPIILPGEVFSKDIILQIKDGINKSCLLISNHHNAEYVDIIDEEKWKRFPFYQKKLFDYVNKRKTTPRGDGFYLPFEGEEHDATIILLPYRKDVWPNKGLDALKEFLEIIKNISYYEKVYVGIDPSVYEKYLPYVNNINNVEPLKIKYNDSWARDNTLIFLKNKDGVLRSVDFAFNAWGGSVDGLYSNYQDDDMLGKTLTKKLNIDSYYIHNFVLEGGSIACDGNGTLFVTEACLLSKGRNPTFSKSEIEEMLKVNLNVSQIIWLPHGIINDETNEHIDNMIALLDQNTILLAWPKTSDKKQYASSSKAYKILSNITNTQGQPYNIIKVPLPSKLYITKEEAKAIKEDKFNAKPRLYNEEMQGSYINFYQGKDYIILPQFGVKEDDIVLKLFQNIAKNKKIIPIYTRNILIGGGNIHCITMQIPKKGE